MGSHFLWFPIWKRVFPISIWGCVNPRFHVGISVWKWGAVSFDSPYGNGHSPFPYGDASIPVSIWGSPYENRESFLLIPHMETGIFHFHMGMCRIPIWKRGAIFFIPHMEKGIPHYHIGMWQSPVPYGNRPYGNGVPNLLFPIWKLCPPFPYGDPQIHIELRFARLGLQW